MRPWLATLLLAGCGSPAPLFIARSWPVDQETLLIVTDLDDVPLSGRPYRARPGEPLSFDLEVPDEFRVYAAVFEPSVDFDACPAIFGAGGAPLVPASTWKSGVIRAGDESISLEADDRERFVLSAEGCEVECPSFTTRDVELPTMVHPSDATLFDASSALIVMGEENRMIQIDASLVVELGPPIAGATITSAYRASDGMHWLGASDGRRFVGTFFPTPSFTALPDGASHSPIQRLVVSIDGSEAFSLAEGGEVERWDGAAWTLVGQLDGTFRSGGLAWLGPGEAIAVSQEDRRVMRYLDGETTYETPSDAGYGAAASIGDAVVIGGVEGAIFVDRGEGFVSLGFAFPGRIHALAPYQDGFIAGGGDGAGATHRAATGFCTEPLTSSAIRYLIPIGNELLLVRNNEYDEPGGVPTYATWVRLDP